MEVETLREHLIKSSRTVDSTETLHPTLNSIFHSDAIGHYIDVNSVTGGENINTQTMEFNLLIPYAQVSRLPLRTSREPEQELTQRVWAQGREEEEGCLPAAGSHILKRLLEVPAKGNTFST